MDEKLQKSDARPDRAFPLSSPKVLKREAYEAAREAQDVVAQARERARQIIDEAQHERDSIRQKAEEEGRARGLAEWNQILVRTSQHAEELAKNWEQGML